MKLLLILVLTCHAAFGAITKIQNHSAYTGNGPLTTGGDTFTSNVTAGNLLIYSFGFCNSAGCSNSYTNTISVSDTRGTTYQQDACQLTYGPPGVFACTYSGIAPSSGANTVSITFGSNVYYLINELSEWSGVATTNWKDQANKNSGFASTNATVTTLASTTLAGELIYSFVNMGLAFTSVGAGYTIINNTSASGDEYKIGSAAQSETANWVNNATDWGITIVTYKPPNGAPKHKVILQ